MSTKMACDVDELDINPFFKSLQTKFLDLYNRAQEKCHTICIPQSSSIQVSSINRDFTETHILRPSPYFKGEKLTSHGSNCKAVTLHDDGCTITTGEGFQSKVAVKIISEELAYNKDYEQYRILILDQPLDPKFQTSSNGSATGQKHSEHCVLLEECKNFLSSYPEFSKALEKVDQAVKLFNTNYMVLPNYLSEAAARLENISCEAVKSCTKLLKKKQVDAVWKDTLAAAMEGYVMNGVHDKVKGVVSQHYAADDQCLEYKCQQQLRGVSAEALGIEHRFVCPLPLAVKKCNRLSNLTTPREKLHCLKAVIDAAINGITAYLSRDIPPHLALTADKPCLTSDDLIPILVNVIGQSDCWQLQTDIVYMEMFSWASLAKDMDDLSYCLVTFKAAVQYILNTDFSHLPHQNTIKKQTSIDRLSSGMDHLSVSGNNGMEDKSASPCYSPTSLASGNVAGSNRLERQMSRISKALDILSPHDHPKEEKKVKSIFGAEYDIRVPVETTSKPQAPSQLGDFLSALQDDFMDQPFGKQV